MAFLIRKYEPYKPYKPYKIYSSSYNIISYLNGVSPFYLFTFLPLKAFLPHEWRQPFFTFLPFYL